MSNKRIRFNDSLFYDPKAGNDRVVLEARCEFFEVVLKHEPDLLEQLKEKISPVKFRSGMVFLFDTGAFWVSRFSSALNNKRRTEEKVALAEKEMEECAQVVKVTLFGKRAEVNAIGEALRLADFYQSTCLHKLGDWALSMFLRFAHICERHELDPTEPSNLYSLVDTRNWLDPSQAPLPPQFTFSLLPVEEYRDRIPHSMMTGKPWYEVPTWFYDDKSNVYVSYQLPLTDESFAETAERAQQIFKEAMKHHEERCLEHARSVGLESFSRGRKRIATPENRFYWLYLYLTAEQTTKDLQTKAEAMSGGEKDGKIKVPSVKKAIQETAELLCISIPPFGENDKFLRWLEELQN